MKFSKLLNLRTLTILIAVFAISVAVYGFAAANVVPESGAGDGDGTISGYTVSNITYTLNTANPDTVDSVAMDVAATDGAGAPSTVKITVDAGTTWIDCGGPTGNTWSCPFAPAETVATMATMTVVAVE